MTVRDRNDRETMTEPGTLAATPRDRDPDILLDVRGLRTYFNVMDGTVKAVDGVDFKLRRGGTLGIVGESGCGKSVTAHTIMRLIETPPGEIVDGEIWFDGRDLLQLPMDEMRKVRGNDIAMIFQEPMTSLNPVFTVGDQIGEAVRLHQKVNKKQAWDLGVESLRLVGLSAPERRAKQYPHEMSGGMRQRVMIAMALSCNPKLLIADEPTTALDVTIQAQILELIKLQEETGTALLLITHDLSVVAETVQHIAVMYAGRVVETGTVEEILLTRSTPTRRACSTPSPARRSGASSSRRSRASCRTRSGCRPAASSSRAARITGTLSDGTRAHPGRWPRAAGPVLAPCP